MKIRKYISIFAAAALLAVSTTGCDDERLGEINVNPNSSTVMTPDLLLTYYQNGASAHRFEMWRGNLLHASCWSNQMMTPWTPAYLTNDGWASAYWDRTYQRGVLGIEEVLRLLQDEQLSDSDSRRAIARIWRVWTYHRLTDFWGDIPYSQAGKGSEGIQSPAYDQQKDIYMDMLSELKDAASKLTAGENSFGNADLIYDGDHDKWIRFANSLRLRLALRISKVDPGTAETHVRELANADLIEMNEENARMRHEDNGEQFHPATNGTSAPVVAGFNGNYLTNAFVDILNERNDPRVAVYGLPNAAGEFVGYPNGTAPEGIPALSPDNYSLPNPETVFSLGADAMFLSAAESHFLMAEAALKGWGFSNPETHYEAGIKASFEYLSQYDATLDADAYLAEEMVAFDAANAMEQIITQKWISLFTDGWESYAEVRRTGFPTFAADQVNGTIPKRLRYPSAEQTLNADGYAVAAARLANGDDETSPVWWDVD